VIFTFKPSYYYKNERGSFAVTKPVTTNYFFNFSSFFRRTQATVTNFSISFAYLRVVLFSLYACSSRFLMSCWC